MRRLASPAGAIAALLVSSAPSAAQVTICNEFVATIHVALARQDHKGYAAVGWWSVPNDACQRTTYTLQAGDTLHYAADSDAYRNAGGTLREHWGNVLKLFVSGKDFNYANAEKRRPGAKAEMFSSITAPSKPAIEPPPVAVTLHFKQGDTSVDFAEPGRRDSPFDQLPDQPPDVPDQAPELPDRPPDTPPSTK